MLLLAVPRRAPVLSVPPRLRPRICRAAAEDLQHVHSPEDEREGGSEARDAPCEECVGEAVANVGAAAAQVAVFVLQPVLHLRHAVRRMGPGARRTRGAAEGGGAKRARRAGRTLRQGAVRPDRPAGQVT